MANATPAVSQLRRRMIDDMTVRNLSPATQRSYLHALPNSVSILTGHQICDPSRPSMGPQLDYLVPFISLFGFADVIPDRRQTHYPHSSKNIPRVRSIRLQ